MAEKIKLELEVDGLDNIGKEMEQAEKATKNLRQQLKEATLELQELATTEGVDPNKVQEAAIKVGELKDAIADANEQANIFASGSKYERVSNSIGQISSGIANLDFGKAAERAQAFSKAAGAITFKDAIKSVGDLGKTFVTVGRALLTNPLFLLGTVITLIVKALYEWLDSMGYIQKALDILMMPLNLLLDGLKALGDWLGLTSFAEEEAAEAAAAAAEKRKKAAEDLKKVNDILYNSMLNDMSREIALMKAQGASIEEIEEKELDLARIKAQTTKQRLEDEGRLLEAQIKVAKIFGLNTSEYVKQLEEIKNAAKDAENNLLILEATVETNRADRSKKSRDKAKSDNTNYQKERLAAERQIEDLRLSLMEEGMNKELAQNQTKYARLIEDTKNNEKLLQSERDAIILELEKQKQATEDQIKEQDRLRREAKQKEDEAIQLANAQKAFELERQSIALRNQYITDETQREIADRQFVYENELIALQEALDNKLLSEEEYLEAVKVATERNNKDVADINQKAIDDEIRRRQELRKMTVDIAMSSFKSIADLATAFAGENKERQRKAFNLQKGVQIAQTTIDTFRGAQAAFTSFASIPVVGPALGAVAAAAAVAAGIANIKKIADTKFDEGGGGSAPSAPAAPNIPDPTSAPVPPGLFDSGVEQSQGEQAVGQRQQTQVIKAIVVESDITNTQNTIDSYQQRSEIG